MKKNFLVSMMFALAIPASAFACWNDSECPNDKVCQCPSSSPTGNCSSAGQCVPDGRDWKSLKSELTKTKAPIDLDFVKACLYEGKAYSVGAKMQFTYDRPVSGLVAQEVLECVMANLEKKDASAYWKTYSVSCKNPITNKTEGCM